MEIANTPQPPYYAVIFTAIEKDFSKDYKAMANQLANLVNKEEGFLGYESVEGDLEITISYWKSLKDIKRWKSNETHQKAQKLGQHKWYSNYRIRIAKVEKEYGL